MLLVLLSSFKSRCFTPAPRRLDWALPAQISYLALHPPCPIRQFLLLDFTIPRFRHTVSANGHSQAWQLNRAVRSAQQQEP
jgi:hypothetical protein